MSLFFLLPQRANNWVTKLKAPFLVEVVEELRRVDLALGEPAAPALPLCVHPVDVVAHRQVRRHRRGDPRDELAAAVGSAFTGSAVHARHVVLVGPSHSWF